MIALFALLAALLTRTNEHSVFAAAPLSADVAQSIRQPGFDASVLSPFWEPAIQRWGNYISTLSEVYGFHPDFIAAVIKHESGGQFQAPMPVGPVGLMGVMESNGGMELRPLSERLLPPSTNLRWGLAILSYVVQQSGGDLYTALAAYRGGWEQVNSPAAREYASRVLDSYGRALLVRAGQAPEMAAHWTVAVDIRAGNVPSEPLLVLGNKTMAGLNHIFAAHTVYAFADRAGRAFYIRGYVVPLGLSEVVAPPPGEDPDELEAPLRARLGDKNARSAAGNPRVLLACLASLERLRGQVTTRWYAPSGCPASGR